MMREDIIRLGEPDFSNPELVAGAVTRNVDGNTIEIDGAYAVDVEDAAIRPTHAVLARLLCRIPLVDVEDSGINPAMPHAIDSGWYTDTFGGCGGQ